MKTSITFKKLGLGLAVALFSSMIFAADPTPANNNASNSLNGSSAAVAQQAAIPAPNPIKIMPAVPKPAPLVTKPDVAVTPAGKVVASVAPKEIPSPPDVSAKGYILIDADSGFIIAQKNINAHMAPASLTKLMTMYVISGFIKSGQLKLTDLVNVSETAWKTGGSRMFIQVGSKVPVEDLVHGITVASGNDACVAMSEHLAGSEKSFVDLMNKTSEQLGMKDTHYADATGLPDPQNYTSPYDLAILARAIIQNYPEDYQWYKQKWMVYNNIKQPNRNLLLWRDNTVDGLKTGFTNDAGYCLAASAKRGDMRLIAIIMNAPTPAQRAKDAEALLNYGFNFYQTVKIYGSNQTITNLRVAHGKQKEAAFGVQNNVVMTVPRGQQDQIKANLGMQQPLTAPISKGKQYGTLQLTLNNQVVSDYPVVALSDNPEANIISQWVDDLGNFVRNWF